MDPYDEATGLFPALATYRKLVVALITTAAPLVIFLTTSTHTTAEVVAACVGYVLANFGIYQIPNAPTT